MGTLWSKLRQLLADGAKTQLVRPTASLTSAFGHWRSADQDWADSTWQNGRCFFAYMCRAMRGVLTVHPHLGHAAKRSGLEFAAPGDFDLGAQSNASCTAPR